MKSKHFTRTTKFDIVMCGLAIPLISSIIVSCINDFVIGKIIYGITVAICVILLFIICFSKPDYNFHVQYDSPYVIFKMSEDDIRVFYFDDMKIHKKNSRYLIVYDDIERMTIPYSKEIEEFLRELI